jgi:protein involved in polysaccharide export with SLBB domain
MTRIKFIFCGIASALFLQSCDKILEPVSLLNGKRISEVEDVQEDFEINIKSLTFASAREANNASYPRRLMQNGIGSEANVLNEADFLTSNMPVSAESAEYYLGIGDKLLYTQLNEFTTSSTQFPTQQKEEDYLLGIGDELTLIQLNEAVNGIRNVISGAAKTGDDLNNITSDKLQFNENILKTSGLVGTDGNILLLGLGSIKAKNRSLNDIQTEVRNIMIRNGLAPSFQLEITGFNSRKAFVTFPNPGKVFGKNVVSITNLPITLRELIINYGVRPASKDTIIIKLARNGQYYRMALSKLFDKSSPRIVIQDRDQIEIEEALKNSSFTELTVGSRGNILIPSLGSIKAKNRSLPEVQKDITSALLEQGLVPSFQLEVNEFNSRKFFLMTEKFNAKAIALNSLKLNLKDAVLNNILNSATTNHDTNKFTIIELRRNNLTYRMSLQKMLNGGASRVFIQDGDTIEIKHLRYKTGKVFALGGAGNAQLVPINPSERETLADILFTPTGALNNLNARRSEVYLLRGKNPSVAYHLDAQNVSKILVAAKTELRPNDIIYVADRPIISFSRTLSEIIPLRTLLRDLQDNNIP